MIILDILFVSILFVIVLMVLAGMISLCERKLLATVQLRIGPAIFFFGLLTPITDGLKLFVKFILFVIYFDVMYFIFNIYLIVICVYFNWFLLPITYIIIFDINFTLLILLLLHLIVNLLSIFVVGCLLLYSCYIYMASIRSLIFTIIGEATFSISIYVFYLLDYFSFLSIKDFAVNQIFLTNAYLVGVLFILLFIIVLTLDGLKIPFDYLECESELVAGIVVEFSGFFFVIYSLLEINHILIASLLIIFLNFGGYYMTLKSLFVILFVFLFPRAIGTRVKITTAQTFTILFLYFCLFLFFLWFSLIKIIIFLF